MLYSSILLIYNLFFKATVGRKDRSAVVSVKSFVMIVNSWIMCTEDCKSDLKIY